MDLVDATRIEPEALHAAFVEAFSDYLAGPFVLPFAAWPGFFARQAIDLVRSRVMVAEGRVVAFAFVAPRGDVSRWRLATMGAVPAARGSGAAPRLLDDFLARAEAAGQGAELEVFAQNERARRLYEGRGFVARHSLCGWSRSGQARATMAAAPMNERPLEAAWDWLAETQRSLPDLPLQVTPQVLKGLPQRLTVWGLEQAQLVFNIVDSGAVVIHSLVDREPAQQDAQALLHRLIEHHGSLDIRVPPLQRQDVGGEALQRAGFERQALHQLLMQRP